MQKLILPKVIGHRGAAAYAPENTLASFNKALMLGCKFIEFDVALSANGEAFIFHDDLLMRTTNGCGAIERAQSKYLYSLDAGGWFHNRYRGQQIPSLAEVLQWLTNFDAQANIEIKPSLRSLQVVDIVTAHLKHYWPKAKPGPLISSFDFSILKSFHKLEPKIPLGLLLDNWDSDWLPKAQDLDCFSIHHNKLVLNEIRVKEIKQYNYKLLAYTVNKKHQALKFFNWGIDGIFSDYPDLL